MMSLMFLLLPLLLGSVVAYLFFKPRIVGESKTRNFFFKLNILAHFKLLIAFMGVLILLTIAAEFITPKNSVVTLPPKAEPNFEEDMYLIEEQIMNRQKVDDAMLFEKRTHPAGDALVIRQDENFFTHGQIYIERKNNDDQTIEEFIYKPALLMNDEYDFSDIVQVTLPVWTDNIVSFPTNKSVINFVSFREAPALAQFTTISHQQTMLDGYSSLARLPIIHLIVPEDLAIITDDEDYLIFIDE